MQALIVASLSLIGVLIGATLQYAYGQRLESRKLLSNQKALAYTDYFKAVTGLGQGLTSDLLALAADAKTRICLFGAPEVLRALREFEEAGSVVADMKGQKALAAVISAMRSDLLGNKFVEENDDLSIVLFGLRVKIK